MNLARYAAAAGVHRFVFISSIKVNGVVSEPRFPFSSDDIPTPEDGVASLARTDYCDVRSKGATPDLCSIADRNGSSDANL